MKKLKRSQLPPPVVPLLVPGKPRWRVFRWHRIALLKAMGSLR